MSLSCHQQVRTLVIGRFCAEMSTDLLALRDRRVGGGGLGGAASEQNGDTVDDGITAVAAGAADGFRFGSEGLAADRAGESGEIFGPNRHRDKVLVARCYLPGSRFQERRLRRS